MSKPDAATSGRTPGPGYEALISGAALWRDPNRVVARVEGERSVQMLSGLLSADIESLEPGEGALSFVLTSKGRPVAVPRVVRLEDGTILDVSRVALPGLLDHFRTYLPPRFASVSVLEDARRLSLIGPAAQEILSNALGGLSFDAPPVIVERESEEGVGADLYFLRGNGGATAFEATVLEAGAAVASEADYEARRVELGLPLFGRDVTPDNLPQETGLVSRAVSFDKGCYTGQEVVARIHYRGQVNRYLRGVQPAESYDGPALPPGTELLREGRAVGAVTSWCTSPRLGPIGLALVRREVDPGSTVQASAGPTLPCVVREIPFTIA
jgi:folate-binding protein YgfZ